jgi:hypothetical protein
MDHPLNFSNLTLRYWLLVSGIVVKGSGHWLMEEATHQIMPPIIAFLDEELGNLIPRDCY